MNRRCTSRFTSLFLVAGALSVSQLPRAVAEDAVAPVFDRTVATVLAGYCLECHRGPDVEGGLDLSRHETALRGGESGPAVVPGNLDESVLWERVKADEMPPKHPLPEAERKILRDWIAGGAKWGTDPIDPFRYTSSRRAGYDWWSLQPLASPDVPTVEDDEWSVNAIDRFVLRRLRAEGLAPSPRASPRDQVRRLHVDLIGLPPSAEVIDRFVADPSDEAWGRMVDELLASPRYAERWARHWLDVARFGESDGYEYNAPREHAWPYRDWVIRALNDDLPYDEFARRQIAGDVLDPNTVDGAAAVGFLVAGTHNTVLGSNQAMKLAGRHEELEEIAGTVAQTFLGLTVNCARCHDHKFDPIGTDEYYAMVAALDGVTHGVRHVATATPVAAKHERLVARRDAVRDSLVEAIFLRTGTSVTANQVRTRESVAANHRGRTYRVSFDVAPTVWAGPAQATAEGDGVVVNVVDGEGRVLAAQVARPTGWNGGEGAGDYRTHAFEYTGNGNGDVRLHLRPTPVHSGRFGGAIDDLAIEEVARGRTLFEESFNTVRHPNTPGLQADTGFRVHFGGVTRRWEHAGTNTIHTVERAEGDFALQLFAGGEGVAIEPGTPTERRLREQLDALDSQLAAIGSSGARPVFTVVPRQPETMHVLIRGDVSTPGKEVAPAGTAAVRGVPASFGLDSSATDAQRRLALANWISHRENGLFHRVAVNRVWHHHFGQGLLASPSDFGFNGGRPSHPALLDWLATSFRENGYSLKKLHRLIVTSETYRQSSLSRPGPTEIDGGNRLLWRQTARRIEGEVLRDSLLAIAGRMNETPFGPGFRDVEVSRVQAAHYYLPIDPEGTEAERRTIYRWHVRGQRSALLDTFDCPDPSTKTPRRLVTTTPSQALSQWNDSFVLRMSQRLAERVERARTGDEEGDATDRQVNLAWRLVLGRFPTDDERSKSSRLVREHGLPLLCRVLFNANEFVLID